MRDWLACCVAERVGFEPTVRLPVRRISSAVQSTTLPPLRRRIYLKVRARTRVDGHCLSLALLLDHSLALPYWEPARPAFRTISPQRTISAATHYTSVQFDAAPAALNSVVAIEILNALRPGSNFTWNLNVEQRLSNGLNITLAYDGRKASNLNTVHTGRMQVAVLF